ncbi:MAG TPA: DUF3224 domain-containing protein [Gemmatimonadaceae bacterium]
MTQLTGTFDVLGWEEQPYDAPQGLPKLTYADVSHALHGDIEGEASVTYLMGYRPDGSAVFVGLIRVIGSVEGKHGSFVMQDVGTYENTLARGRWTIVPGFGTGSLRELRGNGYFAAAEDSATYMIDVSF